MLAGIDGRLLSIDFLEKRLEAGGPSGNDLDVRRLFFEWQRHVSRLGPASTPRTLLECAAVPLLRALGLEAPSQIEARGTALATTVPTAGRPVALLVTPWGESFDPLWRVAVTVAVARGARWSLLFDGMRLRIVDAGRIYARRYLEFDLAIATDDFHGTSALQMAAGVRALGGDPRGIHSLDALVASSDRHAEAVCQSLRRGVLSASRDVFEALIADRGRSGRGQYLAATDDGFEQALTIVYRMLFLFFAEARRLVPLWHPIYRESYSLETLRDAADRRNAKGLWDSLRAIARLAHAGCQAGDLRVTPFNGRLFAPARTPLAERRGLDDEAARRAIEALSTRPTTDRAGREKIAYRDLGVEQLGAVYETLLDYQPRGGNGRVTLEPGSGVRKSTGTFYTPQPIADYLVRRTLGPLVHAADPDRILQLRVVDPAMGSGAFLVAACRFLAQAYETALVRTGACLAGDIGEPDRAAIRRSVCEHCLYGVDRNPMAVQLARLSLWLATLSADRPLSFLDHRLQVGDSLIGAWLASLRQPPRARGRQSGRESLPLFSSETVGAALCQALPIRFSLESHQDLTLNDVRAKERALARLAAPDSGLSRWKRVANLWCGRWFAGRDSVPPSAFGALSDEILGRRTLLPLRLAGRYLEAADAVAAQRRFFHWELEFPEVFFDATGVRLAAPGFDAVLGNPPWDMIRGDAGDARARVGARLEAAPVIRFTRDAGVYASQSDGHPNQYQLFAERAIALTKAGGRVGLVLPSGILSDHGSAALRRDLLTRCQLDAIVSFDNHHAVFPIHRSVRFVLITASPGTPTTAVACRMGVSDPAELESMGEESSDVSVFPIRLTPATIARISGPDLSVPHLRTPTDLRILERAVTLFPPLGDSSGWSARFGRELNVSDDRDVFREAGGGLPIVEGKLLAPFRVAMQDATRSVSEADARRLLPDRRYERPRLAYRDVASATNRTTLIAAVIPSRSVSLHTVFCLRSPQTLRMHHLLCGLFNSFVVNFLVRMRVGTHVTTGIVERLPIPLPETAPAAMREISTLSRSLSRTANREVLATLNARVAALYQMTINEFAHVLATFPLVDASERESTLETFRNQTRGATPAPTVRYSRG